jgi:hypothetical protein
MATSECRCSSFPRLHDIIQPGRKHGSVRGILAHGGGWIAAHDRPIVARRLRCLAVQLLAFGPEQKTDLRCDSGSAPEDSSCYRLQTQAEHLHCMYRSEGRGGEAGKARKALRKRRFIRKATPREWSPRNAEYRSSSAEYVVRRSEHVVLKGGALGA